MLISQGATLAAACSVVKASTRFTASGALTEYKGLPPSFSPPPHPTPPSPCHHLAAISTLFSTPLPPPSTPHPIPPTFCVVDMRSMSRSPAFTGSLVSAPLHSVNQRLVRPAWSLRHAKYVRGLQWCHEVPPNPPPPPPAQDQPPAQAPPAQNPPPPPPAQDQPPAQAPIGPVQGPQAPPWGRWLDRDTNGCLNPQRIGESMQRPIELCSYKGLEALPTVCTEYQQGYKRVNEWLPKGRQSICDGFTLLLSMAKEKRRTVPRPVPEDLGSDIEDRDEALQPDLTEAQRNRKVSGEARAARDRDNTYHGRKCKLAHLIDHLPQELWDAFLDDAVQPRVEAISERAVLASLLFGLLVRGLFTIHVADPLGLHDQPVYTDIPVSQAAIADLSCRNLFLQLVRGLPGNGANTRPNAAVAAVLAAHPDLRDRLAAIPRHPSDTNMVDHVGKQLETAFSNMLTLLFAGRLKKSVSLAGAKVLLGTEEHQRRFGFRGLVGGHLYSEAKRSQVRGLMSSTSYNIRFYDRDVSTALNIRRCAVGPGPRPTELCYWDGRPAMPKPGRPGQEWVYLRDKALLPDNIQTSERSEMAQVKPITPVRRSRSGRPSSTGTHDIPDNAQLELLPPDLVCATSSTSSFGSLSLIGQAAGGGPAPPRMSRGQRPSSNEAGVAVRKRPSQVVQLSASRAQTPSDTSLQQSSVNSPHWTAQPTSVFSQPQSRPPLQPRPSSASAPVDPAWVQGIPMADVGSRSLSVTKPASDKQEGRGSRTSSTRTSPAGPSSQLPGSASGPKRTDPIPPHPGSSGVDPPGMRPELSKPVVRAAAWDEPADPGSISLLAAARAAKTGAVPAAACAGPGPVAAANGQGLGMLAVASCQAGQQLGTSASGELRRAAANMVPDGETPGLTASASSPRLPSPLPASTPGLISRPWTPDSSGSLLGRGSLPNSAPQLMRAHNQLLGQSTGSATQLAAQGVDEHGLQAEDAEYAKYLQSRRTTGEAAAEAQKDHFSAPPDYSFLEQAHHQLAGLAVANMPPQQQQGRGQAWQQQGQPTSRQVNRHVRVAHAAGQSPGSMRTSVDAQSTQLQQPMQRPCRAGATAGQPARPGSAGEAQGAAQGLVVSAHLTETDSGWDPVSVTSINPQDWAAVSAHRQAAVPLSPAGSAVSGRTGGASGVFFTALRRSFGAVVPGEEEEVEEEEEGGLDPTARSVVGMDAMSMRSRTNPMQEPGSSEDEADYQAYINGGDAGQASGLEGLGDGVSSEWGNPLLVGPLQAPTPASCLGHTKAMQTDKTSVSLVPGAPSRSERAHALAMAWLQTPQATMAPDAEVSDASLVSMFHDLYEGTGPYTQPGPPEQLRPTPTTPSASSTAGLGVGTTGEGEDEKEEEEDGLSGREALAAAKANMLVINQAMEEQQQRCSELGEYMDQIRVRWSPAAVCRSSSSSSSRSGSRRSSSRSSSSSSSSSGSSSSSSSSGTQYAAAAAAHSSYIIISKSNSSNNIITTIVLLLIIIISSSGKV
ncbi:hypothetical protein QJQ45_016316 [Haematococcus lacustris]|nr:hypothetical protein QJQ45_016316 [Haematococcus lacustris]